MKTFIRSISLLIILSLGLFSCKTASIMKRHYNKGYYVSKKHKPSETKTAERTTRKTTVAPDFKPTEEFAKVSIPENGKDVIIRDEPFSKKAKKGLIKDGTQPIANAFNKLKDPFDGVIGMPRQLKETLKQNDVARDALSLLWILILILLIVYVIGLLLDFFGLGPIFHILGVIVLVLLILWLLRVI